MTQTIDTFLIQTGFDACEIKTLKHRNVLYVAILTMSLALLTFTGLAANAWFF